MTESPMTAEQPPRFAYPFGQGPHPVVPPPARRRRSLAWPILATILITGVVFGGGASLIGWRAGHDRASRPAGSHRPPATSVATGDGMALKGYIVAPSTGATDETVQDSSFGVQTPAEYAQATFTNAADETARLAGMGLAITANAEWTLPNGDFVRVCLLQFHNDDGATAFVDSQHAAYASDPTIGTTYPLANPNGGFGAERKSSDSQGDLQSNLVGQDGQIVLFVIVEAPGAIDRDADNAMFTRQFAALTP